MMMRSSQSPGMESVMGWGPSAVDKARAIAKESGNPTDALLFMLLEEVSALRQDLAEERKAAAARRAQESRHGR